MKISIKKEVFEKYPELNLGILIVRNYDNKGSDPKINLLLSEIEEYIKTNYTLETVEKDYPWKKIFEEHGLDPKKTKTALQTLMHDILSFGKVKQRTKLQNLVSYISLKKMIPISIEDLDEVFGDICLTLAKGNEVFIPLEGDKEKVPKGEIIYKDDFQVLATKFNFKECFKTKVTEKTENAIIYIDGIKILKRAEIESALRELGSLLSSFGAKTDYKILDKSDNSAEIIIDYFDE